MTFFPPFTLRSFLRVCNHRFFWGRPASISGRLSVDVNGDDEIDGDDESDGGSGGDLYFMKRTAAIKLTPRLMSAAVLAVKKERPPIIERKRNTRMTTIKTTIEEATRFSSTRFSSLQTPPPPLRLN